MNLFPKFRKCKVPGIAYKKSSIIVDFINRKIKGDDIFDKLKKVFKIVESIQDTNNEIDKSVLTLSTLHSSKGLEWNTVWILDCSEGSIPPVMQISPLDFKNDEQLHAEDERRLFYVGITRAVKELNITFKQEMSPFLAHADLTYAKCFDLAGDLVDT